jgi:hypothetical protein
VRTMRSHPGLRWLARALILVMIAPYLLCPAPAQAQRSIPSVYVLDFNNRTKVGGALLGKVAAAQMSLQLSESQNWDVVPDAQVQRRIQDLNLKQPFDRVDRVNIATGIDATAAIYGHITQARVAGSPPQAYVQIQVLVEDVQTGVLINGAIADGSSTPRMGFNGDADILLEEALGKAAFKAREFMDRFRLPEGTVLNTTIVGEGGDQDLDALINIGARQGVRRGMEMIVTRQREVVGRVKISSVDSDISTARVVNNTQGVRPEDRVRAIFNFADFPLTRSRMRAAADATAPKVAGLPGKGKEGDAAEAEPVKVAKAGKQDEFIPFRQQDKNLQLAQVTVDEPAPVVVDEPDVDTGGGTTGKRSKIFNNSTLKMLVGGLLVLGILSIGGNGGENASRPDSIFAFSWQSAIGAPGAFIKLSWDRPKSIKANQVLQYVVWRTSSLGDPLDIVGALDTDSLKSLLDSEATRTFIAFDGSPGTEDAGGRVTQNAPGIVPGVEYRYQIATAYENGLEDRDGDMMPDDADFMSPLSASSQFVTAIAPPLIVEPTNGSTVDLDEIIITWQQTPGANQYVIWVSREPNFSASKRVQVGPFNTVPINQGGDLTVTQTISARSAKLRNATNVFIAVGARNSQDPRPKPFGAIFSSAVSVQALPEPPPPPGGGGGGGGTGGDPPSPPLSSEKPGKRTNQEKVLGGKGKRK